jgi:hypothetical protein
MTTLFEDELKPRMKAGTITPPLVVTAQQNGLTVFSIALNVDGEIVAATLADFLTVTFSLPATIRDANVSIPIDIP